MCICICACAHECTYTCIYTYKNICKYICKIYIFPMFQEHNEKTNYGSFHYVLRIFFQMRIVYFYKNYTHAKIYIKN